MGVSVEVAGREMVEVVEAMGALLIGVLDDEVMGPLLGEEVLAVFAPGLSARLRESRLKRSFLAHGSSFLASSEWPSSPPC